MTGSAPPQQVGVLGVLAFLVELVMLALLALSGWRFGGGGITSVGLAVAFVAVAVVVWGRWMAPRSEHRLRGTARAAVAIGLFAITALVALLAGISAFVALPFVPIGGVVFVATRNA